MKTITSRIISAAGIHDQNTLTSTLVLLSSNSIIIAGILILDWQPWLLLFIIWSEGIIIGVINIIKMTMAGTTSEEGSFSPGGVILSLFFSLFFTIHFGLFTAAHGFLLLVLVLFSGLAPGTEGMIEAGKDMGEAISTFFSYAEAYISRIDSPSSLIKSEFTALTALFISRSTSFLIHFIGKKKYRDHGSADFFGTPYRRVVLMHVVLIVAVGLIIAVPHGDMTLRFSTNMFILLVVLKIFFDVRGHLKEHGQPEDTSLPQK